MKLRIVAWAALLASLALDNSAQRTQIIGAAQGLRSVTIITEPNATVWVDEIRRGTTDTNGTLSSITLGSGSHTLRVRASGFKESSTPIAATQRGEIRVRLLRTTDEDSLNPLA